jgi:L-lactate dehydrogenase (cytochrome)
MANDSPPMKRHLPRLDELVPLIRLRPPNLDAKKRRLQSALTIWDLREIARRRTPRAPFDYTDGAADGELSLARARQAFQDVEFNPSILRDVSVVDASSTVLEGAVAWPFGIAPTGFTRMMHTEGEVAGARAAGAAVGITEVDRHASRNREGSVVGHLLSLDCPT